MSHLVTFFSRPLDELRDQVLDLTPFATEERYRFIDCDAFLYDHTLTLYETEVPPVDPISDAQIHYYSTTSYVWFGLQSTASDLRRDGSFTVYCGTHSDGTLREDGGPISMKVLEYACRWSVEQKISLLWLDRLCVLQTSRRDKAWQIERMYDIYASCDECIVLPGGLQRLASVYEETSWAERAWTYQEAIVTWEFASVLAKDWYRPTHWLVEGECCWQYLHQLFIEAGDLLRGNPSLSVEADDSGPARPCIILGRNEKALDTLGRIMEYRAYNALPVVIGTEDFIKESTIRQLILQGVAMRVSSRPIDMVLSIIGMMGVQDAFGSRATEFRENDRFTATLALVEAMLRLPPDDDPDGRSRSTMLDLPLWKSLEVTRRSSISHPESPNGAAPECDLPSLQELVKIFDERSNTADVKGSAGEAHWRVLPLLQWQYDVEFTVEDPEKHAQDVARELLAGDLLRVKHGETVRIHHKREGVIELRSSLEGSAEPVDGEEFIFGWSLRFGANGYPYMRFFKFDNSEMLAQS